MLPYNWKIENIIPIVKPRRQRNTSTSKYSRNSLLNTEPVVLVKLLSKRIKHNLYKTEYLKGNQYVFTPPKYC